MAALAITALGLMVCAFALKFAVFPNDQWAQYSQVCVERTGYGWCVVRSLVALHTLSLSRPHMQPVRQAMHTVSQSVWDDGGSGGSLWGTGKQNARIKHPPVAAPDEQVVKARCGATRGDWCGRYDNQTPLPARAPPLGNQSCLWGDDLALQCNFVGALGTWDSCTYNAAAISSQRPAARLICPCNCCNAAWVATMEAGLAQH
jgi:hypothetical protein